MRSCPSGRDCEPFAGKIHREFERWRPDSQSKDQPIQRSSFAADRPRLGEAAFKSLLPEERRSWKQEETDFIKQHDCDDADVWFIVDVRWLEAWKAFIKRNDGDFPGPIDNDRLVDGFSGQPKSGFRVKDDYRGVNSAVWHFWHKRYGGGPVIQREKLDLYAVPTDDLDKTVTIPRRPPADGLDETVVMPRARLAPSREELRAEALRRPAPVREEPAPSDSRRRAASVRPGRSAAIREEPRAEERRSSGGGPISPQSSPSQRSRAAPRQPASAAPASAPSGGGGAGSSHRGKSVPATGGRQGRSVKAAPKCDKCDGPHETDDCPHFNKPRERHKDAWTMLGKAGKGGQTEEDVPVVKSGRVVTQPGDGSCLFHALTYGLNGKTQGETLRREICDFIAKNPDLEIGDNALRDWINYDSGGNVQSYARKMEGSQWGGGIEMAAFTKLKGVSVHVYEKCSGGYRRISAFESPNAKKTVSVLYRGRAHYDALIL